MSEPTILFVYRAAQIKEEIHSKCIICSPDSSETWPQDHGWQGYVFPDGPMIEFAQILDEEITQGYPLGGADVYANEPFFRSFPSQIAERLVVMQNYTCLKLSSPDVLSKMPFFMGVSSFGVPSTYVTQVAMQIHSLDDLPDVRLCIERDRELLLGKNVDRYDAMMIAGSTMKCDMRIPVGAYLPGTIVTDERETEVVYEVIEYQDDKHATMRIHCSDSLFAPTTGSVLRRKSRGSGRAGGLTGKVLTQNIATIIELVGVNDQDGLQRAPRRT